MKFSLGLASVAFALFANGANAANSWAGSNNYYVYALPDSGRAALLDAMQAAGMKVNLDFFTHQVFNIFIPSLNVGFEDVGYWTRRRTEG
jgi:hypothetical protein